MSRFCTLASSSRGNCAYLSGGGAAVLVDAGISLRAIAGAISDIGQSVEELAGVFITHEHTDHIKGLCTFLKKFKIPLYASPATLEALIGTGQIPPESVLVELSGEVQVGGMSVRAFDTSHDAAQPVGLRFSMPDGRVVGIATDLGCAGERIRGALTGCDLVLLESNYDPAMLSAGPYPWPLKRRIAGEAGHLSNEDGAAMAAYLAARGTTRFVLGHLSVNNNHPAIAYQTARCELDAAGAREGLDYILSVAPPYNAHPLIVF